MTTGALHHPCMLPTYVQYPHDMIFLTFSFRCSQVTIVFLMDEYQVKVFHFDTQSEVLHWYDHHNQVQEMIMKNTLVDELSLILRFLMHSVPWSSTLPASHYSTHSHSSRVCHHRKKGTTQAACMLRVLMWTQVSETHLQLLLLFVCACGWCNASFTSVLIMLISSLSNLSFSFNSSSRVSPGCDHVMKHVQCSCTPFCSCDQQ